jgi:hypothetical protein
MGAAIDIAASKSKIYITVNEYTNGWNVQYGTKSMGSSNTSPNLPTIGKAEFQDTPTNKPTPWTTNNRLIDFESDHAKANSLGDHPTSVT